MERVLQQDEGFSKRCRGLGMPGKRDLKKKYCEGGRHEEIKTNVKMDASGRVIGWDIVCRWCHKKLRGYPFEPRRTND